MTEEETFKACAIETYACIGRLNHGLAVIPVKQKVSVQDIRIVATEMEMTLMKFYPLESPHTVTFSFNLLNELNFQPPEWFMAIAQRFADRGYAEQDTTT